MTSGDTPICVTEALHSCRCCLRRAPDRDLTTPYVHLGTTVRDIFRHAQGVLQDTMEDCLKLEKNVREDKWFKEDSVLSEPAVSSGVSDDDCTSQPSDWSDSRDAGHGDHTYAKPERPPAAVPINGEDEDGAELEPARAVTARAREQLAMACSVRLERLRGDEAPHASQTCLATSRRGPRLATRMTDTSDDAAGLRAEEQAYTCDTCGEHFADESRLFEHVQEYMSLERDVCNKTYLLINKCVLKQQKVIQTKGPSRREPRLVSRVTDMPDDTAAQRTPKSNLNEHMKNTTQQQHKQSPYEFNSALAVRSSFRNQTRKLYSCNTCEKQFKYAYYLNRHMKTHTGQKHFMCDACGKTFADSSTLRRHRQIHADLQPYTCDICSKKIRHKYYLIRHIRKHMENPYTCDICRKTFADSQTLRRHQQIHAGLKSYTCDICSKKFSLKGVLVRHIRIHMRHTAGLCAEEQVYTCDTCGEHFTDKSRLIKHKQAQTGRNVCNKTYVLVNKSVLKQLNITQTKGPSNKTYVLVNKSVLKQQNITQTKEPSNKTYVLVNKSVLKQQNIIQTKGPSRRGPRLASRMTDTPDDTAGLCAEEQAYTCDTCRKHFTDKSRLIEHRQICNKTYVLVNRYVLKQQKNIQSKGPSRRGPRLASREADMPDDTAPQRTPKSNLNEHIKNTTQQQHKLSPYEFNSALAVRTPFRKHTRKLYSCDICEKQFQYPFYLNRHIRTHTGQKPFMCDVCGKTFADNSTLRRHRDLHAGLKPYTCDICSKTFRYKCFLVRHIRRHMGDRPYTCDVCSKTFLSNPELWRHQGIHRKPYVCEICGKQFTRKSRLDNHFITH